MEVDYLSDVVEGRTNGVAKLEDLPKYENPPVIEVVCGVQFNPLENLTGPQLGLFWKRLKPDYPICREMPPLTPAVERFEGEPGIKLEFTNIPPMPRYWFTHKAQNGIVQVQRDRFLHNWKKVKPDEPYPHYDSVIKTFRDQLDSFEVFLRESEIGGLQAYQYELTYVNHIPQGDGWNDLPEVGNVFPAFASQESCHQTFLPKCEVINWRTTFRMPENKGRLHASLSQGAVDEKPLLNLNMTARGMPSDSSRDAMWEWFDLAHTWIVRGFADLTSEEQQRDVWRRIQ